jgi:putative two-component system response regulator
MKRILIAEDNLFYRHALGATLKEWGYEVIEANDGVAALEAMQQPSAPKVAIIDWLMPKMDGLEVCRRIRALQQPEPPYLMVLTSTTAKKGIIAAFDAGADDYITKPFDRDELQARIRVGVRLVGLQTSQTVVFAFAQAVEAKSSFTLGHSRRVMNYAVELARRLNVCPDQIETLRKGALVHDIGKICVPDEILNKPGSLTNEEYAIMKLHPMQGVKIVEPLESLKDVIPLIRSHHERLDGSGYPDGLRGEEIPKLVRLLSVADCYDALTSRRPYRGPLSHAECARILRADASAGKLDNTIVECFLNVPSVAQPLACTGTESVCQPDLENVIAKTSA